MARLGIEPLLALLPAAVPRLVACERAPASLIEARRLIATSAPPHVAPQLVLFASFVLDTSLSGEPSSRAARWMFRGGSTGTSASWS